jgi:hypothetical protein
MEKYRDKVFAVMKSLLSRPARLISLSSLVLKLFKNLLYPVPNLASFESADFEPCSSISFIGLGLLTTLFPTVGCGLFTVSP